MAYKILDQHDEITVRTLVKYDDIEEPILIPHFMPKDQKEIELGIENRYISEKKALEEKALEEKALEEKALEVK